MKTAIKIIILILAFIMITPTPMSVAFADSGTVQGSNVLDDLTKDTSFSQYNYLINENDNTIQIITIAESWNDELLIYTYQPNVNKNYRANYISMSTTINDSIDPTIYELTYCNSKGTLAKYVVRDFVVKDDDVRFYEIYSIFRPFDETVDDPAKNDNTINSVSFSVSKQWKFGTVNGNSYVDCANIQTINVTAKYVGFVRYANSKEYDYLGIWTGYDKPIDSHFVAFDTDKPVENLLEADVHYVKQYMSWHNEFFPDGVFEPKVPEKVTVKSSDEEVSFTSDGWYNFGTFSWNRIQTVDKFLENEKTERLYDCGLFDVVAHSQISEETIEYLKTCKWVLRFTETEYQEMKNALGTYSENRYIVSDVTLLRLKFVTAGVTYNLGVVDNMQTGSSIPSNVNGTEITLSEDFGEFLKIMLTIVALAVLSPIIIKFISFVFKIVLALLKWLFGGYRRHR